MPPRAPRPLRAAAVVLLAATVAGCGSAADADLPPPAGPRVAPPLTVAPAGRVLEAAPGALAGDRSRGGRRTPVEDGTRIAVLDPRARVVELRDVAAGGGVARAAAGVGPANAISSDRWLWVTDTRGDALLVFRTRPKLELVRRLFLAGGPYAIALDTEKLRLWVTLTSTNEVAEFPAHGRPHELRRFPTIRQPDAVAVDPATHVVTVGAPGGRLQRFDPGPLPPRR